MATADRVKETSTTTGTGDFTLLGAVSQFQAFGDAFTPPATVSYAIVGQTGTEWEVGEGTLSDATTLERTTVHASSNSGNAVNFSAGTKDVFATFSAADIDAINTAIAGKASSSHTHASGDITGLAASATTDTTNASNISSGSLADARLSSNVPLENAANVFTVNGAVSTPGASWTGTWYTGGTATTTKPLILIEPTGATSTHWSTAGTGLGINAPSGFTGRMLHCALNGSTSQRFYVDNVGNAYATNYATGTSSGGYYFGASNDAQLFWEAAATIRMGSNSATPITQTLKAPDSRAGTDTNVAGGHMQIAGGRGTGTAAGGELRLQTSAPTTSGTTAGTLTTRLTISGTAITAALPVVLQGYTVATLPTGTTGMRAYVTDATAPTYLGALTGGGAVVCPVFYNGSAWVSC